MYNFEKLKVWQEAVELSKTLYNLARKFPKEEKFVLIDQLKRAVTSIPLKHCGRKWKQKQESFHSSSRNCHQIPL
jgi:four helix bundle protein